AEAEGAVRGAAPGRSAGADEPLDSGHRPPHRRRVVQAPPHRVLRRLEAPLALDPHRLSTVTPPSSPWRSSQTRWYGLQLRVIVLPSASWSAEHTAWMPAPPPSPIPFAPSGVKGDSDSM